VDNQPIDIAAYVAQVGHRARAASREMARAPTAAKDAALKATAAAIRPRRTRYSRPTNVICRPRARQAKTRRSSTDWP